MAAVTHQKLFESIRIAGLEIKNRIAMAPMHISGLSTPLGGFSPEAADYYGERARGGTGLIITSAARIENEVEKFHGHALTSALNPDHFVQSARQLTERVHEYGAKIFIQLTAGGGRVGPSYSGSNDRPVAPSAIPNYWDPGVICRELATEEVERIVASFGNAALLVQSAGFDGIEVHAMHEGYLLDQFTIAMFNKRTDKYGGDLRGRLTFPIEVLNAVKSKTGKDYPVILRLSVKSFVKDWRKGGLPGEEFQEKARDTEESLEAAKLLEKAGYDAFDADAGTYDAWYWAHPPLYHEHGCYLPFSARLKETVGVPVLVAGRLELPDLAEKAIVGGKADIVSLGRGLLADPEWANKVMQGRAQDVRPCLGCHGCFHRVIGGLPLSCAVNPACGREKEYAIQPAAKGRSVLVIGCGVAGMEAARVAALRGHTVVVQEKGDTLGGHVREASVPSFKHDGQRLLDWYEAELDKLGVEIRLGCEATPETVREGKYDSVIVATGSRPAIPNVPGLKENGMTATDLLLGKRKAGESVVVVGGGLAGCETALWLAQQGKKVTIVEMLGSLMRAGEPVPRPNRMMLLDLLKFHKIDVLTGTRLAEVRDSSVVVRDEQESLSTIHADTVVICAGLTSDPELYNSLKGEIADLHVIGDARHVENIMNAIWDANEVGRAI